MVIKSIKLVWASMFVSFYAFEIKNHENKTSYLDSFVCLCPNVVLCLLFTFPDVDNSSSLHCVRYGGF